MTTSDRDLPRLTAYIAEHGSADGFVPSPKRKRDNRESRLQKSFVEWWAVACRGWGLEPRDLHAVPNGAMYGRGIERVIRAKILLAEGLRPGYPDVAIDVPAGTRHGLRIEFKLPETKPDATQLAYHELLRKRGYRVEVCRTLDEAVKCVEGYLENAQRDASDPGNK